MLTRPVLRDDHGNPVLPWFIAADDPVADEGDAHLRGVLDASAEVVQARLPTVQAWAQTHAASPAAHYVLARTLSAAGRLPEAADAYTRALDLQPGFVEAAYNLGVVLANPGQRAEAVSWFERAAALDGTHFDAHYNAGMMHYLGGEYGPALGYWCACRQIHPDDFDAAKKVVQALHGLGRFDAALRARAEARAVHARSTDPEVRALTDYVIDQFRVGDEPVMVSEPFEERGDVFYWFDCKRGTRIVTLESSAILREHNFAAILGIEYPDGSHATTTRAFATMPSYEALRPVAMALIMELQRGDTGAIGASSSPSP